MIKVEKFQLKHLDKFVSRDDVHNFREVMIGNIMDPMKDMVSLVKGDEVICIAGVNHLRIGVAEGWLIASEKINQNKFGFFKTTKRLVDFVMNTMGVHRFEIAVDCKWEQGHKWAEALGLQFESIARAYDMNYRDHAIYTRIEKWQQ